MKLFRRKKTRNYEIDERVLKLILGMETLLDQNGLPIEYKKIGYECLKEFEEIAGLREEEYLDYDIEEYIHKIKIVFKENKNVKRI